jgi:hypothetical protein
LLFSLSVLFLFFHLKRPVVVFAIAEDSLHIIQGIFVQPCSIDNSSNAPVPGSGDFGIFLLAYALIFIFRIVFLYKVVEFVYLGTEAGSTIRALFASILVFVSEDFFQPSLFVGCIVLVSVAALEAFEL